MSFDSHIQGYFDSLLNNKIKEAMEYSTIGGKHFRPELIFSIVKGFDIDEEYAYDAALALEMIHSYSLIHDDLPCMDNDDFRRGKPSCHKAYGEDIAVLAGDALLTEAFNVISRSKYNDKLKLNIIKTLANFSGINGMIYGQLLDIRADKNISEEKLNEIQDYKTGALFKAALYLGMYICNDEKNIAFYDKLGIQIGRLFQIQDDLFDVIKSEQETGKTNSDIKNHKFTTLSLYSVEEIENRLHNAFEETYAFISKQKFNTIYLLDILKRMEAR